MINERDVECCKCGWRGTESEQDTRQSLFVQWLGPEGMDPICPKCTHDEFNDVSDEEE